MKTVAFRVEGGGNIGMGHIMRCLSLAREFKRQNCEVIFITYMPEARDVIKSSGLKLADQQELTSFINCAVSTKTTLEIKKETAALINIMSNYDAEILIFDSYNVNEEYMRLLKEHVRFLVYIDDINKFKYPADIIVNGNITGIYMNYPVVEKQKLLLGPDYNLIREEFKNILPKKIESKIQNILLTTGGSDPNNCSEDIINRVLDYTIEQDINIHVVVGSAFPFETDLDILSYKYKNIILHKNVKEMSKLMIISDIAISAGGSTLYELCACGVPTLAFIMADNQEYVVQKMNELGYVKSIGWYDKIEKDKLLQDITFLNREFEHRKILSKKMQGLVDGKGTMRVVKSILEFINL